MSKIQQLLNDRITISTWLTIARIVITPLIVVSVVNAHWHGAFVLFAVAAVTDILDGYLARLRNEQTLLGACLDPIADKLLIISIFSVLAYVQIPYFVVPDWFLRFMVVKELMLITGVGALALALGRITVRPSLLGKLTMLAQVLIIAVIFGCQLWNLVTPHTLYVGACVVTLLAAGSMVGYILQGIMQCFVRI